MKVSIILLYNKKTIIFSKHISHKLLDLLLEKVSFIKFPPAFSSNGSIRLFLISQQQKVFNLKDKSSILAESYC